MLKSPGFKANTGALWHIGFDKLVSKHVTNLLTPQPHIVFFRLACQSRASKRKNWQELELFKMNFKIIKKSKNISAPFKN